MKRPKDMTPEELAALPVKDPLSYEFLPTPDGYAGDDLIGFWQDREGNWWREPPMFW